MKIKTRPDGWVQCPLSKYNTKIRETKSKGMEEADSFVVETIFSTNHFLLLDRCKHEKDYFLPNYSAQWFLSKILIPVQNSRCWPLS